MWKNRILATPEEWDEGFAVLKELRTELTWSQFRVLYAAAHAASGYQLRGWFNGPRCGGVVGYRVLTDFVHGRHLYVDDLCVRAECRSQGLGKQILQWAETEARRLGCQGLRLCTGVDNARGKSFYEANGWQPRALAYKKGLTP